MSENPEAYIAAQEELRQRDIERFGFDLSQAPEQLDSFSFRQVDRVTREDLADFLAHSFRDSRGSPYAQLLAFCWLERRTGQSVRELIVRIASEGIEHILTQEELVGLSDKKDRAHRGAAQKGQYISSDMGLSEDEIQEKLDSPREIHVAVNEILSELAPCLAADLNAEDGAGLQLCIEGAPGNGMTVFFFHGNIEVPNVRACYQLVESEDNFASFYTQIHTLLA